MFYAYVIQSEISGALYKGHCQDKEARLKEHNAGKVKSTRSARPWKMVYFEEFDTREQSVKKEKYFKSAAGRKFLKRKLSDQEVGGSPPERPNNDK